MTVLLHYLAAAALGIHAGAMLTEGGVLVPVWRRMAPADFLHWYAAHHGRLYRFFAPVTAVALLAAVGAAAAAVRAGHPGRRWTVAAAVLMVAVALMFPLWFRGANHAFATARIPAAEVPAALARWGAWHAVRTVLACVALAAAMAGLRGTR